MQKARLIVISGERGSGKSTLVRRLVTLARGQGQDVAGLVTMAVYVKADRMAITVRDVRTGRQALLAERCAKCSAHGPRTPDWCFHEDVLAWSNAVLLSSLPCDLFVVDELGPLELERGEGWRSALDALRSGQYRHALVVVRPSLLARFYELCPGIPACTVMLPPDDNRDALVAELTDELGVAA